MTHNDHDIATQDDSNVSVDQRLMQYIDRIERLEEEKKGVGDDIKDVYSEVKSVGFDPKAVKQLIKLRKKTKETRLEEEAILETYKAAIGME
jgi:uncharacterized protein (UPF0335 family)